MALYLLRTVLASPQTLQGRWQMVLDAAPVPEMTRIRPVGGEPLPGPGQPSEPMFAGEAGDQYRDQGSDQPLTGFRTKKAAFLSLYRGHPDYGQRSAAGRVAAELAPLAALQAGTGRTYIAEELRKLTKLALTRASAEQDDDQPTG
jgi:hypothetical protein